MQRARASRKSSLGTSPSHPTGGWPAAAITRVSSGRPAIISSGRSCSRRTGCGSSWAEQNGNGVSVFRPRPRYWPGSVLLSHTVTHAVPSAHESLTSEFGKGSGMASPTMPPEIRGRPRSVWLLHFAVFSETGALTKSSLVARTPNTSYNTCLRGRSSRTAD